MVHVEIVDEIRAILRYVPVFPEVGVVCPLIFDRSRIGKGSLVIEPELEVATHSLVKGTPHGGEHEIVALVRGRYSPEVRKRRVLVQNRRTIVVLTQLVTDGVGSSKRNLYEQVLVRVTDDHWSDNLPLSISDSTVGEALPYKHSIEGESV